MTLQYRGQLQFACIQAEERIHLHLHGLNNAAPKRWIAWVRIATYGGSNASPMVMAMREGALSRALWRTCCCSSNSTRCSASTAAPAVSTGVTICAHSFHISGTRQVKNECHSLATSQTYVHESWVCHRKEQPRKKPSLSSCQPHKKIIAGVHLEEFMSPDMV